MLSRAFLPLLFAGLFLSACLAPTTEYTRIAPGTWRGVLELEPYSVPVRDKDSVFILYDQFKDGDLPFNFEVRYLDDERLVFEFINGEERIRCDSVRYGRDKSQARDTFNIYFPEYQSHIHAAVRGNAMQGYWEVSTKKDYRIPFRAFAGQSHRFTSLNESPAADLSGEWAVLFGLDGEGAPEKAIGEFRQDGNRLLGTFRTETGDYRFLEGTVQGRKFWLSCFDGSHAFRFSGVISGDTLLGEFRSGKHHRALWKAWKDPSFQLADPLALTTLKPGAPKLSFRFETPEGDTLGYPSARFDGKIKVFTIMGTWCPNCKDEQIFLRDFLQKNPELAGQMEVVAFAFERPGDALRIRQHLQRYRERLQLPYPVVYAGEAGKETASKTFPQLSGVSAFPTMMILDKSGAMRHIHTGFDGPATSRFASFEAEFSAQINALR